MALKINVFRSEDGKTVVFMLSGSLDTETSQEFKDKFEVQMKKTSTAVVLDLKGLDYISSMGISVVLEAKKSSDDAGASFMMSNVPAHIEHVFKTVNVLPDTQMFENREEADRYFKQIQERVKEKNEKKKS